jgi:DNA-binding CsgD family transcriptional regulator
MAAGAAVMTGLVVGRDAERAAATRALATGSVMLDGPAGIGKTVLWRSLVDDRIAAGSTVLIAASTETEQALPYAALADLLQPLAASVDALPPLQAQAARAVLLTGPTGDPVDERTIAVMTLSLLTGAGRSPLVAIDDCQWLDPPTERALRYALRRLPGGPRVLLTMRGAGDDPLPLGLETTAGIQRITVPPVGVGAMHHIVRDRLGANLNRPLLTRVTAESGGNPMLAIELVRAVLRLPSLPRADQDLPVAGSVRDLVIQTLRSLPERTLTALRMTALLGSPTLPDLVSAGVDPAELDPAEEVGLVQVGTQVRFGHPLHATAIRADTPAGLRRRLQLRLAATAADPDERARLLARAITQPDEAIAEQLEQSGRRLSARGAPGPAADLFDRSADLTPADCAGERARRMLAGVRARYDSGDHAATAAAADRAAGALTGDDRAEALLISAVVGFVTEGHPLAVRFAESALRHADPAGTVAGRIHAHLAVFDDHPARAVDHGNRALELIPPDDRPGHRDLRASAMLSVFYNEVRAGRPARRGLLADALALEAGHPSWLAGSIPGLWWTAVDEHERAWTRMRRQLAHASASGDEPLQLEVLLHLVQSLMLAGRWDEADDHLAEARSLGEQLGAGLDEQDYLQAQLGIYRGDVARWAPVVAAGLNRSRDRRDSWGLRVYGVLDAQLALHSGDSVRAADSYRALAQTLDGVGLVEPLALRWEPDWIEACVGAGDLDQAERVLESLEARHQRLPRPWTALGLARSRVLVGAAEGADTRAALDDLAAARATVPEQVVPLDRARCLLVAGLVHRRSKRRGLARECLTAAVAELERLGAKAFAARARAELGRVGVRADDGELTATERRVAVLAAQGRTNRVIAERLFISPKTVEANLARAYRKLGIATRAELGARLGGH